MGMAASQCRLVLLTARKSDLELQGQEITQRKMMLSMQTEQIANDYTTALNSRKIMFNWGMNSSNGVIQKQDLTYAALTATNTATAPDARVTNSNGDIVVNSMDITQDPVLSKICYTTVTDPSITVDPTDPNSSSTKSVKIADIDSNGYIYSLSNAYGITSPDVGKRVICAQGQLSDQALFQNAIRQGTLIIQTCNSTDQSFVDSNNNTITYKQKQWSNLAWQGDASFSDDPDDANNAYAYAIYESKMARVEALDKQFDTQLNEINNQREACQTEIDSVNKVIDKNITTSFKIFQS